MSDLSQNPVPGAVRSRFSGMRAALGALARARSAKTEYNTLMMLSDASLAARGLSRDGIARYVGAKHLDI